MKIKQKIITLSFLTLFAASSVAIGIPNLAFAEDGGSTSGTNKELDGCKVKTSIVPVDCSTGGNPIWGLLLMAINILTAGIGIVAVGGVIYASILWTTAEDKNAQIVKSKETIFNVVVGLVAFALLYAFLQFLIPGGVFNAGP